MTHSVKTPAEMIERAKQLDEEKEFVTATYLRLLVEKNIAFEDGNDHFMHQALVRTVQARWNMDVHEDIVQMVARFRCGIAVHKCSSDDPRQFLILVLSSCDDGDICVAVGQGDDFQCSYIKITELRHLRIQLTYPELIVLGLMMAERLRHVARGRWIEDLQRDTEAMNMFFAQRENEGRKNKGQPTDA